MNRIIRKRWLILCLMLSPCLIMAQQLIRVQGSVTAVEDGKGIPGASVSIKGTSRGTLTDYSGNFSIEANLKSVIRVSSLGFDPKEISLNGQDNLKITLNSNQKALNEVVVTALGIKRERRSLSYSVGVLNTENVQNKQDAIEGIAGRVAGVSINNSGGGAVGSSTNIIIRGGSSLTANNQPLFIVDGVRIDNSVNNTENTVQGVANSNRAIDIDPNDIESYSVLRGGNAVVLYGLDGTNGVVLITTKHGRSGKGSVEFSSTVTINKVNRLPYFQNIYAQGSDGLYMGPETGTSGSWGPRINTLHYDGASTYPFDKNGSLIADSAGLTGKSANTYDNVGNFFKTSTTYNNYVAFSGGSNKTTYRFSGGIEKQEGVIPTTYFQRNSIKFNGQTEITPHLTSSFNISYINSGGKRAQQGSNISGVLLGLYRTPISFDNLNGQNSATNQSAFLQSDGLTQRNYRGGRGYDNPYFTINKDPFFDDVNRVLGGTQLSYNPLSWLTLNYNLTADVYSDRRVQQFEINTRANPNGLVINDQYVNKVVTSELTANFKKDITKDISASLLLGNTYLSIFQEELSPSGNNLNFPGFVQLSNANSVTAFDAIARKHRVSYLASLDLSYKNQLFLNAGYRIDKSTTLDPNHNSFNNPSLGLSWVFSDFLRVSNNPIFNYGKLRASFATSGNDAGYYLTNTVYSQTTTAFSGDGTTNGLNFPFVPGGGPNAGSNVNGFQISTNLGNSKLKAEKIRTYELGTELAFFKNRLTFDFTYYYKKSSDLILSVPFPASTGFLTETKNAASLSNKGVEILLNVSPVVYGGFKWDLTGNFTKNVNKVISLAPGVSNVGLTSPGNFAAGFTGLTLNAIAGYPTQSLFGPVFLKDPKGNLVIEDDPNDPNGSGGGPKGSGVGYPIAGSKSVFLGSTLPKWTLGITNTFTYKGIVLSGLLDVKHGGVLWNGTEGVLTSFGRSDNTLNRGTNTVFKGVNGHLDGNGNLVVTGTTNTASVPLNQAWYQKGNGGGFGNVASQFVQDASWVRLRELTFGYEFDRKLFKSTPIRSLRLTFVGNNLWLSTKYHGIDPETSLQGAGNAQGIDYFQAPGTKTYSFKLNITVD